MGDDIFRWIRRYWDMASKIGKGMRRDQVSNVGKRC